MSSDVPPDHHASLEEAAERYRLEREKRLRAEGNDQYRDFSGAYADFDRDPYADPDLTRDPVDEDVDVVIVGAGFGGMLAAAGLRKAGIDSFRIIDKAGDFGGTWYWNRYPGAACDVESYVYLPLLEETGYMPTEKYAKAPEIFAYCQLLGRHFDLYDAALFQTEVASADWDEGPGGGWSPPPAATASAARFVVIAGGVLHKAKLPGIPGIETFTGHRFHTSRWDYAYTGGGPFEPDGGPRRQARRHRRHRRDRGPGGAQGRPRPRSTSTCSSGPRRRSACATTARPTPSGSRRCSRAGRRERIRNFTQMVTGAQPGATWSTTLGPRCSRSTPRRSPTPRRRPPSSSASTSSTWRPSARRVERLVDDPATAEALKPWYGQNCKRPVLPRRVPADVQPPQRHPGRHRRPGRRADHRRPEWSPTASSTRSTA